MSMEFTENVVTISVNTEFTSIVSIDRLTANGDYGSNTYVLTTTGRNGGGRVYWSKPGFQGSAGYIGSQGYTGSQGIQGYTGSKGLDGGSGAIGYTGSKGDQGNLGYTGSQGSIGYTGSKGADGANAISPIVYALIFG